jgi:hypothetical protein
MSARSLIWKALAANIVTLTMAQGASATMPSGQEVVYRIHETPTDPQSAVVFTVAVKLVAEEIDGAAVGWRVATATFNQKSPVRTWVKMNPVLDTPDGLWWITHADPMAPLLTEFLAPPLMYGTADAQDTSYADLDFEYAGASYVSPPPPGEPPYGENTAAAIYWFQLVGITEPEEDSDEDEPVETDDTDDP